MRRVAKWANGGESERHGHLYLKRPMGKNVTSQCVPFGRNKHSNRSVFLLISLFVPILLLSNSCSAKRFKREKNRQ